MIKNLKEDLEYSRKGIMKKSLVKEGVKSIRAKHFIRFKGFDGLDNLS